MNYLILKHKAVGATGPFGPAPHRWQTPPTGLAMFLLAKFTGTMLLGIAISTMLATSLLCSGVLFQGLSFVIEFLMSLII